MTDSEHTPNRQDQDQADKPKSGILTFGWNLIGSALAVVMFGWAGWSLLHSEFNVSGGDPIIFGGVLSFYPLLPALLAAGVVTVIAFLWTRPSRHGVPFNYLGWFVGAFCWSLSLTLLRLARHEAE